MTAKGGQLEISGLAPFAGLPLVKQKSDFHCVCAWSAQGLEWEGYRFRDFYERLVLPALPAARSASVAIFHCHDGYRTFMQLEDLFADDVLLATALNGKPLTWEHGAPMRLVAPAHYGFKSAKFLREIIFQDKCEGYRPAFLHWHEHPRARVALEERATFPPRLFWRYFGRLAIPTVRAVYGRAARKRNAIEGRGK